MLDNVTTHVEKAMPSNWTANTVTIIGNLGMVLAGLSVESLGVSTTYLFLAVTLATTSLLALLTKSLRSEF